MMRSLVLRGAGDVGWEDADDPVLVAEDDALVRPIAVALCDADIAAIEGRAALPTPYPLGHEFVGTVTAVGSAVTTFAAGDTVVVSFQICCGRCSACADRRTGNCLSVPRLSMYGFGVIGGPWGGAFSDLVRVPYADYMLQRLPPEVSPAAGANIADNLTDAWRLVVPPLQARPNSEVLVLAGGAPSVALWAAELAILHGASCVTYVDGSDRRRSLAEEAGAVTAKPSSERRYREVPITVDASGDPAVLVQALRSTAPDGVCLSAGIYWQDVSLPLIELYSKNATFVTGRPHSRAMSPTMLNLVASKAIDPLRIATVVEWDTITEHLDAPPPKLVAVRR